MHGVGIIKIAHAAEIHAHTFLKKFFFFEEPKKLTITYMN
jgi:hypothetical protein